jgi:uncharacterized protein (DUF4415 family)
MFKRVAILVCAMAVSASVYAQQPKAAAAARKPSTNAEQSKSSENKSEPAAKPAAEPPPQPVNVKIEVSITDQSGSGTPARKVVTMIAGDRQRTSIRSSASVPVKQTAPGNAVAMPFTYRNVTINVDARPAIVPKESNKVLVSFGLEYFPKPAGGQEEMEPGMASFNEQLALILESGKPTIVSLAADPTSDRKITVEVTATILR